MELDPNALMVANSPGVSAGSDLDSFFASNIVDPTPPNQNQPLPAVAASEPLVSPVGSTFGSNSLELPIVNPPVNIFVPVSTFEVAQDHVEAREQTWEEKIQSKTVAEENSKRAMKEEAEKFLDSFHDQQTDKKLLKMENNRKTQNEVAAEKEHDLQEARVDDLSRWKRVYDLTDVNLASDAPATRMHKLLLNLKINGLSKK